MMPGLRRTILPANLNLTPTSRAHNENTLTLGKWKKSGAINNSTRIIIKTTGMLQSCQTREYTKKMCHENAQNDKK